MKTYRNFATTLCLLTSLFLVMNASLADPLTEDDIKSFNIADLKSSSFDTRMKVFRIIKEKNWQAKYKKEAVNAIVRMLQSNDVMQQRTGIQGENLLQYNDKMVDALALALLQKNLYKKGNQQKYLRQSLIEYTLRQLKLARNK